MAGLFSFTTKPKSRPTPVDLSRPSGPSRTATSSSIASTSSDSSASSVSSAASGATTASDASRKHKAPRPPKYKIGIDGLPMIPEPWTRPKVPEYIIYSADGSRAYCDACQKHITMEPSYWQDKGVYGHMSRTRHKCQERFWLAAQDVRRAREKHLAQRRQDKGKGRADC